MLAVVAATLALLGAERLVVTDRERVQETLYAAAQAVENNQPEALERLIDSGATDVRQTCRNALDRFTFRTAKIASNLHIELRLDQQPATAESRFTGVARLEGKRQQLVHDQVVRKVEVQLVQRGDQWLISDVALP